MSVSILNRTRQGEYFIYRVLVDDKPLRDTISIPVEYIMARSEGEASTFVEKQARALSRLFEEQDAGNLPVYR